MKVQTESLTIEPNGSLSAGNGSTLTLGAESILLLPQFATANLPAAAAANKGMLVYDKTDNSVKFSTGAAWVKLAAAV